MAWSYVLLGVLRQSIATTWPSASEIATPASAGVLDLRWGPGGVGNTSDWAGISATPQPIGEILNAHERRLQLMLNGLGQASFTLSQNNPMAFEITDRDGDVLVKIYEDTTLRFVGECVSVEEVGDGNKQTVACTFADPFSRLSKRLCRKPNTTTGRMTAAQPYVQWTATEAGQVITDLVDSANLEILEASPLTGDTGIRMGTVDTLPAVTVGTDPEWNYKPIAEAIVEMQAANPQGLPGAFDFQIVPVEPTSDNFGLHIADLNIESRVGADRPNVVFEYGGGNHSVRSYRFVRARQDLLNRAFVAGADPSDDSQTVVGYNTTSQEALGLYEAMVPIDVGDATLRQQWADANVTLRGQAKWTLEFEPSALAPSFGMNPTTDGDYGLGDTVRARIRVAGEDRLDGNLRVYGIDLTIDDEGKETLVPQLVRE